MKIIWYEDMKADLISIIREMATFLGKHLTELKVLELDDFLYIDNFRNLYAMAGIGLLVRKGKVGM